MSAAADNPAVEAEEEKPVEREYRVLGTLPVFGTKPEDTFKRVIPLKQEQRLIGRGSIERVEAPAAKKAPAKSAGAKEGEQKPASTTNESKE